jgi:hypothetical protein
MLQERLVAGDSLNFATSVAGFSASDGWQLFYLLVPRTAGTKQTLDSDPDSTDPTQHRVSVSAATTAGWTAGHYTWHAYVSRAAESYTVGTGTIEILADPRSATLLDLRTSAQTALDNINALLAGKATTGTLSYRIGERTLESYSITELLQLKSHLQTEVAREANATDMAKGLPSRRVVNVRLARA